MDQGEAGLGQHGLREPRDPADDVEADTRRAAERYELFGQPSDVGGGVQELAVEADGPVRVGGGDPVQLLCDVDADADRMVPPSGWSCSGLPPAPSSPYTAMDRRA